MRGGRLDSGDYEPYDPNASNAEGAPLAEIAALLRALHSAQSSLVRRVADLEDAPTSGPGSGPSATIVGLSPDQVRELAKGSAAVGGWMRFAAHQLDFMEASASRTLADVPTEVTVSEVIAATPAALPSLRLSSPPDATGAGELRAPSLRAADDPR